MAPIHGRRLLVAAAALTFAGGCTAPASAQHPAGAGRTPPAAAPVAAAVSAPPARAAAHARPAEGPSRLWQFKRLYNVDYVDVREIAGRMGLKAAWVVSGRVMNLVDGRGRVRLRFENRDRDFLFDGVRVFMGEATAFNKDSLYVSRIDVVKTIVPLLRPSDYAAQLPGRPRTIVIDPGHGGNDPGNQNQALHLSEKDMTLDVARRLGKLLEARGYRVVLTRSDDRRVELEERAEIARRARGDLFLSIHFNSLPAASAGRVTGCETYTMTPQFLLSSGAEEKDQLTNVAFPGNRHDFANAMLGYALHRHLLTDLRTSDRGDKRARFVVLRLADCPAALVEAAYLSNHLEARRIGTPAYREQIAGAIADGVDDYAASLAALQR